MIHNIIQNNLYLIDNTVHHGGIVIPFISQYYNHIPIPITFIIIE